MMQRPGYGPRQAKLAFLVGNFKTVTRILPNPYLPDGAKGTGTSGAAWTLDSMFVVLDEENTSPLMGKYKTHGLLGYDMNSDNYQFSMFSSFGDHPVFSGNFSGDTLVLAGKIPTPEGPVEQKILLYKKGKAVAVTILSDMGSGEEPIMEATYTPVAKKKK